MRPIHWVCLGLASASACLPVRADRERRLFDFTPASGSNPVVAVLGGSIQIPLSELRAYRSAERAHAITDPGSLPQKRAVLDDLINEYLYVDEAYRTGVAQSPAFLRQMEATRTMILTDFMSARARSRTAAGANPASDPAAAMADRLFDAADIRVSNEAYAVIARAATALTHADEASHFGPVIESRQEAEHKLIAIVDAAPEAVAVRFADKSLTVHQILAIYAGLPAPRPKVQTHEDFLALIKPLVTPELMAIEAVQVGIADQPDFQDKLIQNRNALLRFHMQDLVERQAADQLGMPDTEAQLAAWYREHPGDYTAANDQGAMKPLSFEQAKLRVAADYSVVLRDRLLAAKARELRKACPVSIDERALGEL